MEFRKKKLHVLRCNVHMVDKRGGKSDTFEEGDVLVSFKIHFQIRNQCP